MKPTLFISHATLDKDLAEAVEREFSEDFETFLDSESIAAGDEWRAGIEQGLLHFDAALVLLSERSIEREWVRAEAAVLAIQARVLQDNRIVIPLLVDDLDIAVLSGPRLGPAGLDANQAPTIRSDNPDLSEVRERLQPLADEYAARSEFEDVELYIASKIESVGDNARTVIGRVLGVPVDRLPRARNPARWLAGRLLALRDLDRFEEFIRELAAHAANGPDVARSLLNSIFPYCWVDRATVARLSEELSRDEAPRTAVGLVTEETRTSKWYVLCASRKPLHSSWPVFECTPAISHEDSVEHVIGEIMAQARENPHCRVSRRDSEPTPKVLAGLKHFRDKFGPLVVLLPPAFNDFDGSFLDELNHRFQHLNFLFTCSEPDSGLEQRFDPFILLPRPEHDEEEAGYVFEAAQYDSDPERRT